MSWRDALAFGLPLSLRRVASHFFQERKQRLLKRFGPKSELPSPWQLTLVWQVTPLRSPDSPEATDEKPERALQNSSPASGTSFPQQRTDGCDKRKVNRDN